MTFLDGCFFLMNLVASCGSASWSPSPASSAIVSTPPGGRKVEETTCQQSFTDRAPPKGGRSANGVKPQRDHNSYKSVTTKMDRRPGFKSFTTCRLVRNEFTFHTIQFAFSVVVPDFEKKKKQVFIFFLFCQKTIHLKMNLLEEVKAILKYFKHFQQSPENPEEVCVVLCNREIVNQSGLLVTCQVLAQFSWFSVAKTQKSCDETHESGSENRLTHVLFQFNADTRSEGAHTLRA